MSKDQWIADVERLEERFADDQLTADEFTKEMRWMGFDPKEIEEIIARVYQERGDEPAEPRLSDPAVSIPRMINGIVADLDELMIAAREPDKAQFVEAELPAFGQMIMRAQLIASFIDAHKPPLKVVGGSHQ